MRDKKQAWAVVGVSVIAILAQVLLALWREGFIFETSTPNPSLGTALFWMLHGLAISAVVAVVGPRNDRIWLVVPLVLIVTLGVSFFAVQFVLSVFQYQRDYTQVLSTTPNLW
jgi:hypothetical protein